MRLRAALVALVASACTACATHAQPPPAKQPDPFVRSVRSLHQSVVLFTMQIPSDDPKKKGSFDDAYGSGLVVASGDWGSQILTVEHVIHEARNLRATVRDKQGFPARTIARDERDDLALVETNAKNLVVAHLGSSAHLEPGTAIGIAGYPIPDAFVDEGLGTATSVFAGRISSIVRDALELDVPVIPGESGGPVFDAQSGVVVGLAESRFEEEKAIGFAIPIDDAKRFMAHTKGARVAVR